MAGEPEPIDLADLRRRIDAELRRYLAGVARDLDASAAGPAALVHEIVRLLDAGGKRLRPILCVLGHVSAGGRPEDALPAAAALELFHTFALVHDDVMDEDDERRGVPSTHRRFAMDDPGGGAFGRAAAILVGDLSLALSMDLLLASPAPPERVLAAARRFRAMAVATAGGQFLDLRGGAAPDVVASLKTAVYTTEAPLAIGAELAGAGRRTLDALEAFAHPLGVAFQLLDDLADGARPAAGWRGRALGLLDEAERALGAPAIAPAVAPLRAVVALVRASS